MRFSGLPSFALSFLLLRKLMEAFWVSKFSFVSLKYIMTNKKVSSANSIVRTYTHPLIARLCASFTPMKKPKQKKIMQNKWCLGDFSHMERIRTQTIHMTPLNDVHRAEAAGDATNASIMHIYKSDDAKNANRWAKATHTHTQTSTSHACRLIHSFCLLIASSNALCSCYSFVCRKSLKLNDRT